MHQQARMDNLTICYCKITHWRQFFMRLLNSGIRPTISSNNLDLLFADLKLGIIDMYLKRLKERQHRKK